MMTIDEQIVLGKKVAQLIGEEIDGIVGNPFVETIDKIIKYIEGVTGKPVAEVVAPDPSPVSVASPMVDIAPSGNVLPVSQPVQEVTVDAQPSQSAIAPSDGAATTAPTASPTTDATTVTNDAAATTTVTNADGQQPTA